MQRLSDRALRMLAIQLCAQLPDTSDEAMIVIELTRQLALGFLFARKLGGGDRVATLQLLNATRQLGRKSRLHIASVNPIKGRADPSA